MPPRTRIRSTKVLKENIDVVKKSKAKSDGKITKPPRKALADKTNSLSDDNASIDIPTKTSKKALSSKNTKPNEDEVRPRRERRLPPRYIENQTLKNLSNCKDSPVKQSSVTSKTETTTKELPVKEFLNKTPQDFKSLTKHGTNILSPSKLPSNKKASCKPDKPSAEKQVPITKFLTKDKKRPKRNCCVKSVAEKQSNDSVNESSAFKTPSKDAENSLVANKPKRVCRLPSRFENHSISPNKFIPVQPCHASTPIQKSTKNVCKKTLNVSAEKENDVDTKKDKITNKNKLKAIKSKPTNAAIICNTSNSSTDKNSPDSNNNGKKKVLRPKRAAAYIKLQSKQVSPIKSIAKRLLDTSYSFMVLEDRQSSEKGLDVYEFTFDPNEEPTPKKKRKRPAKKRTAKPKTVVFKSIYDNNVSKALANLKSRVKPSQTKTVKSNIKLMENFEMPTENPVKSTENYVKPTENHVKPTENHVKPTQNHITSSETAKPLAADDVQSSLLAKTTSDNLLQSNHNGNITPAMPAMDESVNSIHASNYASIRVEDIAADFEFSDHHNDINYSPVNSPQQQLIREHHETIPEAPEPILHKDPLNLQENVSFFEEPPVASSSMNVSVRDPLASPWRVEFGSLPMKWHNNTYVKANMTPAVGCSFINSEATKKKHVYTNMIPEQEPLPEIFENTTPALKQTSIISFIKEVAERKANKKKRRLSQTSKAIFGDFTNETHESPKKAKLTKDSTPNTSNKSNDSSKDKENSNNSNDKSLSPEKKKDKECTYFGFDESENIDQENLSPIKVNLNPKTRVLRSRNVLQELNTQPEPTRAAMPISAKAKLTSSEVVEQVYDQLKSAEDAQFPVKETAKEPEDNTMATNVDDPSWNEYNEDSQSVHLFEDIEVVHHMKLHRKSYGKAKKVTFQQSADSNSDSRPPVRAEQDSSDDDDLADLSFHLPVMKQTNKKTHKKKPKKQLTKKEEKEVEEWAAGFNSMCEDIDEFALLVE